MKDGNGQVSAVTANCQEMNIQTHWSYFICSGSNIKEDSNTEAKTRGDTLTPFRRGSAAS